MIALIESDQSLRLANLTPWEEEAVDKAFSAFDPRARFVEGEWDGVTRRFDRVNKRLARPFLAGLRKVCAEHNFALAIRDQRPPATYTPVPTETINQDWLPGITLKDFQVDAIRKACKCEVGLFAVAVSGGKTELMAGICKAIRCPTVIIAEQVVVVRQIQQRLKLRLLSEEPGLFYAGKTPSGQLVIIGSIQSLLIPQAPKKPIRETFPLGEDGDLKFEKAKVRHAKSMQGYKSRRKRAKALRKLVAKCDMLLVDECDLATSNMYKMLFRYWFKGRRRFGFTGTPYDEDKPVQGLILQEHLGSVIFRQSRLDVERAGLSIPIDYYTVVFGRPNNKFDGRAFDIAINEDIVYNEEFHRLIERICHKYRDEGTLILVQRDDLGKALAERIPDSAFVHGTTPQSKREQYLRAFEKREIKVLIGGKNVRRGLDLRGGCETQIIATGGKSTSDLEQQLGRSRRLNERGRSRVFDFFFYTNKYLYSHSRKRLKAVDAMGFRTFVVFPQGVIDGKAFVKSRFRTPNWRKLKR